jgi:hypothetical protein
MFDYSNHSRRVVFADDAPIASCFRSALKVYRILQPDTIDLEEKELGDSHMLDLMEFMAGREMIRKINLRRNKIGDEGAKALARFITSTDDTLVDINLNRNRITQVGIDAILDAVHTTIRIEKCACSYGN